MIDVVKKIATIINKDPEKILLLIQANQNKKAPEKLCKKRRKRRKSY